MMLDSSDLATWKGLVPRQVGMIVPVVWSGRELVSGQFKLWSSNLTRR